MSLPNSCVFSYYRTIEMVSDGSKFILEKFGNQFFITTSVGNSFHTYNCENLRIVVISETLPSNIQRLLSYYSKNIIIALTKTGIFFFKRGRIIKSFPNLKYEVNFAEILNDNFMVFLTKKNKLYVNQLESFENYFKYKFDQNLGNFNLFIHPFTYLNKILVASDLGNLVLLNIKTGVVIYQFTSFMEPITCLEPTLALDVVAVGLNNGHVKFLNLKTATILFSFCHDFGAVYSCTFRNDGINHLAVCSSSGPVSIWDMDEQELITCIKTPHSTNISNIAYIPGNPILISASEDNSIKEWVFDGNEIVPYILRQRNGPTTPISQLKFYYDSINENLQNNFFLISSSFTDTLHFTNCFRDEQNMELSSKDSDKLNCGKIINFSFSCQKEFFWDNCVTIHKNNPFPRTWNLTNKKIGKYALGKSQADKLTHLKGQLPMKSFVTFCGNYAVISYDKGAIEVFSMQTGSHIFSFEVSFDSSIKDIAVDHTNQYLITGSDIKIEIFAFKTRKSTRVHEFDRKQKFLSFQLYNGNVLLLALLLKIKGRYFLKIFDIAANKIIRTFPFILKHRVVDYKFMMNGSYLAVACQDKYFYVWDIKTNNVVDCFFTPYIVNSLDLSANRSEYLAISYHDQKGIFLYSNRCYYQQIYLFPVSTNRKFDTTIKKTIEIDDICKEMSKISLLPDSKWLHLVNIEVIMEKNRPKELNTIIKRAPFFLTANDVPEVKEEQNNKRKKFTVDSVSDSLVKEGAFEYLMNLNENDILLELKTLSVVNQHETVDENMIKFLQLLKKEVMKGYNFDFVQGVLALLFRIYITVFVNTRFYTELLKEIRDELKKKKKELEDMLFSSSSQIEFLKSSLYRF